jgi:hypothetical protein
MSDSKQRTVGLIWVLEAVHAPHEASARGDGRGSAPCPVSPNKEEVLNLNLLRAQQLCFEAKRKYKLFHFIVILTHR